MAITRVIVSLPYYTNVPEDVATNTFYFASVATPDSVERGLIAGRLGVFYLAIDQYLSPVISGALGTCTFYDMADPLPRSPVDEIALNALTVGSAGMAEEVSICCSYYATPVSGESAARRRGRVFIGPLASTALTASTSSAFSQPALAARTAIAGAAAVLADQSETSKWAVYSPTDLVARNIVAGWVDNSFDTQRRRGRRPTARTTWTGQP